MESSIKVVQLLQNICSIVCKVVMDVSQARLFILSELISAALLCNKLSKAVGILFVKLL